MFLTPSITSSNEPLVTRRSKIFLPVYSVALATIFFDDTNESSQAQTGKYCKDSLQWCCLHFYFNVETRTITSPRHGIPRMKPLKIVTKVLMQMVIIIVLGSFVTMTATLL